MLYLLDTACLEDISRYSELYPLAGVTTNPTLIARENIPFPALVRRIRESIGTDAMLHVQATGASEEDMVREGRALAEMIGGNVYIKIPVVPEGLKAMKALKRQGIAVTATAVFTPQQALLAAMAGADFVAPYVNRLDAVCGDGIRVVAEIAAIFREYALSAKVLAASFKNAEQVHKASLCGSQAVTVSPDILEQLAQHPLTTASVEKFRQDWEKRYGKGVLTVDLTE